MRTLGIITARGGSKSVPRKNLAIVRGRPLLQYTVEAARAAKRLDRVVLSTDDEEIADVGRSLNVEVPFMRPAELAQDDTPTIPVLQHVVRELEREGDRFDAVFTLQPTTPLRTAGDIDGSIELLDRSGADSVIGFSIAGSRNPARMKFVDRKGRVVEPPFADQFGGQRRQEFSQFYWRNGSIYLTRYDVLMNQDSLKGNDSRAYLVPIERACDIDEPFDIVYAEFLIGLQENPEDT